MSNAGNFFSEAQRTAMQQAVVEAEGHTSGEIRIHIENHCKGEVLDRAAAVFHGLKMDQTRLRNGVLFYLAVKDHKFAILGDEGINKKVPEGFWNHIRDDMEQAFQKTEFTEGLCAAIRESGKQLKQHFPFEKGDSNELNNEVSFGQ